MFGPSAHSVSIVLEWLETGGVDSTRAKPSSDGSRIQFQAKVEELETLFNTKYHLYRHKKTGRRRIACDELVPQLTH
jgi:tripeptidyl-peptidase-1